MLSNARLSGARTAFAKVMAKEYGDAGGLDDLLLYCPNCRNEVAGLKNSKNQIRVKCKTCGSEMVRTIKYKAERNEAR